MDERTIFLDALEIENISDRASYLDEACDGDPMLRHRIEQLLDAFHASGQFLDVPALDQLAAARDPQTVGIFAQDGQQNTDDEQMGETVGSTSEQQPDIEDVLEYLQPSEKPTSLGRLGHYEIEEILGKGAFGTVLRAIDEKLRRVVAIKVMAPQLASSATARKRFIREAQAAAAIRDEHVVAIHAVEESGSLPFLVMEFIDGVTLSDKIDKDGGCEVKEILRIGMQTASGLAAAHRQGLIHRDIKPANILLENGVQRVKITDFGLARAVDDASITGSGIIAGTPMYMSPEQAEGKKLDHRSDLFSLGSVLYTLCVGRPAFRAESTVAVLKRVCEETPRSIREINSEIPDWLEGIVAVLMAKQPSERFQTAEEVADLLGQHLSHLQDAGETPHPKHVWRKTATPRKRSLVPVFAALLLLTVGIWIAWLMIQRDDNGQEPVGKEPGKSHVPTAFAWPANAPTPAFAPFNAQKAMNYQEAWAEYLSVPVAYTNSIGMKFILIPPGEFMMGSTPAECQEFLNVVGNEAQWHICINGEAPRHKVILTKPIYLGVHEVTQAEYEKVMGKNPSLFAQTGKQKAWADKVKGLDTSRYPVESVSWHDAANFCTKLSELEKLKPFSFQNGESGKKSNGIGYRLPTEAQWEFACRAGTTTRYWTGDKVEDLRQTAWFDWNSRGRTHQVGELKANPFGLHDMHGNVWEWVQDGWDPTWYKQFQKKPALDPCVRFSTNPSRIVRGGDWRGQGFFSRSAIRFGSAPWRQCDLWGLRVALAVDGVRQLLKKKLGHARPAYTLVANARRLMQENQPRKAQHEFEKALAIDPDNTAAASDLSDLILEGKKVDWDVLKPVEMKGDGGQTFTLQSDGSVFVSGPNPEKTVYTLKFKTDQPVVNAIRLEAIPDSRLPFQGAGRYPKNGHFHLTEVTAAIVDANGAGQPKPITLSWALADIQAKRDFTENLIDGNENSIWATNPPGIQTQSALIGFESTVQTKNNHLIVSLVTKSPHSGLGRFRISVLGNPKDLQQERRRLAARCGKSDPWEQLAIAYDVAENQAGLTKLIKQKPKGLVGLVTYYCKLNDPKNASARYAKLRQPGEFPRVLVDIGAHTTVSTTHVPFDSYEAFTVEAWVRGWYGQVIQQGEQGDPENNIYLVFGETGDWKYSGWESGHGTNYDVVLPYDAKPGWRHIAMTYDGRKCRFFIDGHMVQEDIVPKPGPLTKTRNLNIGGRGSKGLLGAVRVSKAARYAANFSPPKALSCDPETVLLYDPSRQKPGAILRDLTGNGRDAKINPNAIVGSN